MTFLKSQYNSVRKKPHNTGLKSVALGAISLHQMAGGLEKNIVLLANFLVEQGRQVSLITFDQPEASSFYEIDPRVQWHRVGRTRPHIRISFRNRFDLIARIRVVLDAMNNPIIVCFHHGILTRFYIASFLLGLPLICSERNSLTLYRHISQSKWSLNFLMLALASRITVQFPSFVNDYPSWLRQRVRVIPNPVNPAENFAKPDIASEDGRFILLMVGRLCAQKDQILLINVFSEIHKKFPEWDLYIIGEGDMYNQLKSQIQTLSLSDRVFIVPKQRNITAWFANAHLFCMPSRWEGFPNALAEAMSHGLPSIGLWGCAGVRDLIQDGVSGLLVDEEQLANALSDLMGSPERRVAMGRNSIDQISRYKPDAIFRQWDHIISEFGVF